MALPSAGRRRKIYCVENCGASRMSRHTMQHPEHSPASRWVALLSGARAGHPLLPGLGEGLPVPLSTTGNGISSLGTHMECGSGGTLRGKRWWPWRVPTEVEATGTTVCPTQLWSLHPAPLFPVTSPVRPPDKGVLLFLKKKKEEMLSISCWRCRG